MLADAPGYKLPTAALSPSACKFASSTSSHNSLTFDAPAVTQGSWQTYLIAVYNAGPHPAQGVVMSDPTPTGTVFASLLAGGSCTKPAAGAAGPVSCQIPTLAVGSTWLGLLTVKVTAPAKSTIINEATVTGTTVDPNPGNDTTTVSTPVL